MPEAYAQLDCKACGPVLITEDQYIKQVHLVSELWHCPRCSGSSFFNSDFFYRRIFLPPHGTQTRYWVHHESSCIFQAAEPPDDLLCEEIDQAIFLKLLGEYSLADSSDIVQPLSTTDKDDPMEILVPVPYAKLKAVMAVLGAEDAADPKPADEPTTTTTKGKGKAITMADVKAKLKEVLDEKGKKPALAILSQFKAEKVGDLEEDDFDAVIKACAKAMKDDDMGL